jgi:glyoxylase-like metal-dependent hydrolase (beta-lactamase superfamily II)
MKMHLLSGGRLRMRRSVYHPGAPREERIDLPVISALLKHPQGNVLFDSGCHPSTATDAEARWGGLARAIRPIFSAEESLIAQLPRAGLSCDDIDVVICSHLHFDHCGCNSLFAKATVICHAKELEAALGPDAAAEGYFRQEWDNGRPIETIDAERDVFGDGKLTLLPMPGHTPGMTVAHVALETDGAFLLVSDAVAVQANLDERVTPSVNWDVDLTLGAMDEIDRFRTAGAVVVFGHDDAQWRSLRQGAAFYS